MQTWIIEQSRSLRAAFETLSTDLGRVRQPEGEGATRTTVQNVFQAALTYVAGADGPINEQEGYILHTIFQNDNGRGTYEYIRQNVYKDLSLVSDIESLLGAFVRNLADDLREQGEEYDAASDAVIDFLSDMGELLIAADQDISVEETRALAEIVSPLRAFATQIEDGVVEPSEADLEADNEDDIDEDDGGEIAPFEPTVKLDPLTRLHNLIGLADTKSV